MEDHIDGILLVRSDRKTLSLEVKCDGTPLIRPPKRMPIKEIQRFVDSHREWLTTHIDSNRLKAAARQSIVPLSEEERRALADRAAKIIPARAAFFAPLVGVGYGGIAIRFQHSKWGSCSAKGNLNFNALLLLTPPEVLDAIVVHELCHRKQMNHSAAFYREVYRVCPEYDAAKKWLKENGGALLARLGEPEKKGS